VREKEDNGIMTGIIPPDGRTPPFMEQWLAELGHVAGHIGRADFHTRLLSVFSRLIAHQSSWIIAYAPGVLPHVLHTEDVESAAFSDYSNHFRTFDPFWHLWRSQARQPVASLSTLDKTVKPYEYTSIFQKNCGFSDELAIILPILSNTCIMLFLQRTDKPFTQKEINRARLVQPVFYGLHQSHINQTFQAWSRTAPHARTQAARRAEGEGALVLDRHRNHLHSNAPWRAAETQHGAPFRRALHRLLRGAESLMPGHTPTVLEENGFTLSLTALPEDCPLAPGGYLLTLAPGTTQAPLSALPGLHVTRREQDLLELLLQGRNTGEIAQTLGISKGTVKNHRQRLYRKVGVTTERGLLSRLQALRQQ
jgi:DNA-binding CsgD family transcriptional regulator/predicted lactoylglutathione lyase